MLQTLEEEYNTIQEERRIARERQEARERELQLSVSAATTIQVREVSSTNYPYILLANARKSLNKFASPNFIRNWYFNTCMYLPDLEFLPDYRPE